MYYDLGGRGVGNETEHTFQVPLSWDADQNFFPLFVRSCEKDLYFRPLNLIAENPKAVIDDIFFYCV